MGLPLALYVRGHAVLARPERALHLDGLRVRRGASVGRGLVCAVARHGRVWRMVEHACRPVPFGLGDTGRRSDVYLQKFRRTHRLRVNDPARPCAVLYGASGFGDQSPPGEGAAVERTPSL